MVSECLDSVLNVRVSDQWLAALPLRRGWKEICGSHTQNIHAIHLTKCRRFINSVMISAVMHLRRL